MSKVIKKPGFQLPKVGPQRAILARESYLGFQTNPKFPENGPREQTKILLQLEERDVSGKRLLFELICTLSLAEVANLAALVDAMVGGHADIKIGQEVDLAELVAAHPTCLVDITHKPPDRKGRVWPKIKSFMPLPDGMAPLELEPLPPEKPQPGAVTQATAPTAAQTNTVQPASTTTAPAANVQPAASVSPEPEPVKMPEPAPATSTWHYVPKKQRNFTTGAGGN